MTKIKHHHLNNKGEFEIFYEGKKAGSMTYSWAGNDKFIINHTEVDDAFRGKDLGKELVKAGVEFAQDKEVKIIPLCPFAKATFQRNPDLAHVLA
ncbi:GNAT family N-acetyltransferase [Chryseobacterium koreense]|uniref:N-acetyltransferase domain-containing protein n=1 Tax=Chryseobacterium koreense CCUG 49689 TaxID=1304281 RepID=A0A0J7LRG3_9FLAO|nr:GNAT family N-acetyltransferase [Chryseobacterium koreense]KMQ71570.1 hypothetical protein ACM44_04860 [Chryseobacterium koreense CCUG 49689]MBB5333318.1 hypothetical protein [Chryseobacterium koreense]